MRVLHVVGCYPPALEWGGPPPAVAGYARALRAAGVEAEVFATTARASADLPPVAAGSRVQDGVPVTFFPAWGRSRAFFSPALGAALLRRAGEFDLVHAHMMWAFPGIAAARAAERAKVPYVLTPHGSLDPWALRQRRLEKRLFLALLEGRTLRRAAAVHFTAEAERAAAPAWARALPSFVVGNTVDPAPFAAVGEEAVRAASRDVLVLGRIHPMKGLDLLVPAFRQVLAREPGARLVVAGPDEAGHQAEVEALCARAGIAARVTFTGLLDAAGRARALARAALLAAPSYRENFGMAVAEAMAAGLPVVVSDKVNIAGEIAAAGAGAVVPCDPAPLAEALAGLLGDPARRAAMGARGRALVRARWAPAPVGAALRRAYEAVIAGRFSG
ncbi:glycosyltransferase [Anaeromyxobacter paludicola]|uniref:Glycosyl transferase family 1 n=1 Tax=Anaeromyxobacter paludicola TaxID=2918171 RepID=A0ABM7XCQ2_9BACT|nr:glycosyltransferase [Anaeromyxobacter paludicola]BDG09654.1 glycosyl transferase family 1 [Anaeromyxobacter paludicola]